MFISVTLSTLASRIMCTSFLTKTGESHPIVSSLNHSCLCGLFTYYYFFRTKERESCFLRSQRILISIINHGMYFHNKLIGHSNVDIIFYKFS